MKTLTKIISFLLIMGIFASISITGYAENCPACDSFITDNSQIVYHRVISEEDVPAGIIPLEVNSIYEAETLISKLTYSTAYVGSSSAINTRAAYDALLNSTQYGGILSSGLMVTELRVSYDIVNNRIANASPYSYTYGIPAFADYTETSCTGYVVADTNGKVYYAITRGQLDYYILFEGVFNLYTTPVYLEGQKNLVD